MRQWLDVAALALSQIVGYGTLYYSFGILAPAMGRDFGWPTEWIFAGLSVALLAGGLAAPLAGRWIDRFGAGRVMAIGSGAAALGLVACALAPSGPVFIAALFAIEIASTCVQYGAAFPLLVQRHPRTAQRSIVRLTLMAGFASTIFWPMTAWLLHVTTWREIYFFFAALNLVICVPIHLWLARRVVVRFAAPDSGAVEAAPPRDRTLPAAVRGRGFILMTTAFALQSFISAAVLVHMLPMLGALGLGVVGVAVAALFGPAQVASRFLNMMLGKNLSQLALAIFAAAALPLALALLSLSAPSYVGAIAFALLFGIGNGLYSIVGGTLPLALFGPENYGARQGRIMSVRLIVGAAAPFIFALMMERIGARGAVMVTALAGSGGILALLAITRLTATALAKADQPSPAPTP